MIMRKILLPILAAQALTFNVLAEDHKQHTEPYTNSEAEGLELPSNAPITSYFWTKEARNSRNAFKNSARTTSPLMTAHYNPPKVMPVVNVQPIFWGPSWSDATAASDKIIGLDLWYASVGISNYAKTVSEYLPSALPPAVSLLQPGILDTTGTPSSNASSVLSEVCKLVGSAVSTSGYYPVYTDIMRGSANYCAYHSAGICNGVTIQFAFFFNLNDDPGCDPQSPYAPTAGTVGSQLPGDGTTPGHQESQGLAALANVTAHELAETITDNAYFSGLRGYWGGWYDSTGAENGDKCAWTFGGTLNSPASVTIGGYPWKIQGEWSNYAYSKGTGYPRGCVTGS